jgi:hypothetical protein
MSVYEDYMRHEFTTEVQRELELALQSRWQEIRPQLLDILRTAVQSVHRRFLRTHSLVHSGSSAAGSQHLDSALEPSRRHSGTVFDETLITRIRSTPPEPPFVIDGGADSTNLLIDNFSLPANGGVESMMEALPRSIEDDDVNFNDLDLDLSDFGDVVGYVSAVQPDLFTPGLQDDFL